MGILAILTQPFFDALQIVLSLILGVAVVLPALSLAIFRRGPKCLKSTYMIYASLDGWPAGRFMFTKLVAFFSPFSGAISGVVEQLEPGVCKMTMQDRPWLRNPFNSVHAMALASLAEMTAGLVGITACEGAQGTRGIPVSMKVEYLVKARGRMTCRATLPEKIPTVPGIYPMDVRCDIYNEDGVVVAAASVGWSFKVTEPKKRR